MVADASQVVLNQQSIAKDSHWEFANSRCIAIIKANDGHAKHVLMPFNKLAIDAAIWSSISVRRCAWHVLVSSLRIKRPLFHECIVSPFESSQIRLTARDPRKVVPL